MPIDPLTLGAFIVRILLSGQRFYIYGFGSGPRRFTGLPGILGRRKFRRGRYLVTGRLPPPPSVETFDPIVYEEVFKDEMYNQIKLKVIPEVKRRTVRRTGRLRRSIRISNNKSAPEVRGRWYGAFQDPSTKELFQKIYARRSAEMIAKADVRALWEAGG